jgi:hypothetical protein
VRPPALDALLGRHPIVWEGPCSLTGVGAFAEATQRLAVTAGGDLVFYHGPESGGLIWTHVLAPPHAPGTLLACWEAGRVDFVARFDRQWDPMVATWSVPGPTPLDLWAALRPHLLPSAREPAPLWQSRLYCRGTLSAGPANAERSDGVEPALPRFIRVFAHEQHLSLSICSAHAEEKIGLYGALAVILPYASLTPVAAEAGRRRWQLARAVTVGGQAVQAVEIEVPPIEAADWPVLDQLIAGHGRPAGEARGAGAWEAGVYEVEGIVAGRPCSAEWVHLVLEPQALLLRAPGGEELIATVPYAAIAAIAIQRQDPADDLLIVAPGVAVCVRQAGVSVRHQVEHGAGFALLRQKLASPMAAVVRCLDGPPGRPEALPTALTLEGDTLRAAWGSGEAALPISLIATRRLERPEAAGDLEPGTVRLIAGPAGHEWTARGAAVRLLPLAGALDEAALPGELAQADLAELRRRWQEARLQPLLWGIFSEVAWLELQRRALAGAAAAGAGTDEAAAACELLAMNLDNLKARLALLDLQLPYWAAAQEESFLGHLGEPAAPVRERSMRYVERAVQAIVRPAQVHLQHGLAEIEKNLAIRDQLRQVPRPGKLTLGFDASYCATVATAIGASVLGPIGAVAGVALSGLHLNQETHSQNALQASLMHDYEINALNWWRHLTERVVPYLVRDLQLEGERLSRSLAPRDQQIYDRLAALGPDQAEHRFREALTRMLLSVSHFRWSRIEVGGEWITVGELLDRLLLTPPPLPTYPQLFPAAALPIPEAFTEVPRSVTPRPVL